jgi:nitrogen fixation/metabolism regulation signal transduction histidine kinase
MAVKYRDFSQQFNENHTNPSLKDLHHAFNQINKTFRDLSSEKEGQYQYLQTILELIDTGIISFNQDGAVAWVNESFKQTLELPYLKNIGALRIRNEALYQAIRALKPGENSILKITVGKKAMQLLLSAASFKRHGETLTLIAFKNVSTALDETETEAWQKLLRVMPHEIMNSVAPIASLADTLRKHVRLEKEALAEPARYHTGLLDDVEEGIAIIQSCSEGLLKFAQIYRNFSKITTPLLTTVYAQELFNSIFIPFFTTHKDGSGIGLSLAKQIMHLHRGSIQVQSAENEGSVFRLHF